MITDELTGRALGDFVVRHRIGEGGFGEVYRAEQPALGRDAVIKVLHRRHRSSKPVIQRFLREARLASRLDHPYAAHIYAFGAEPDGLMWIAMELVKGQTMLQWLREKGPMSLPQSVSLLDQICEVLQAAHELGIVHRDIKPANVMVVHRSGRIFPKLLDFGIAKVNEADARADGDVQTIPPPISVVSRSSEGSPTLVEIRSRRSDSGTPDSTVSFVGQLGGGVHEALARETMHAAPPPAPEALVDDFVVTEAGATIGSPPYMAPEQWNDSANATSRSDLYALGVLTFEMLTGRRPFDGSTVAALCFAHSNEPVPPLGSGFAPELDSVIARVLAKQAPDRYPSATAFAHAFREAAGLGGGQPLPALDDDLRTSVETNLPQPIAEALAAYHAARNPHQGREALRDLATTAIRYITMIALAAHTQVRIADAGDVAAIAARLRELRRRAFTDDDWLALARDLTAAYVARPEAHPVPELVRLLHGDALADAAHQLLNDVDVLAALRARLPQVTRLLRALAFLADYTLVVAGRELAESWMGVRRPRRVAIELHARELEPGRAMLVDSSQRPVVSLWPVVQISAPLIGAAPELFLLEGRGRRGARLVALPQPLERQDERVWDWLAESFDDPGNDHASITSVNDAGPYRGLTAYTRDDAESFVGREREIDAAVNRLRVDALVAVVGPSGVGKSSFVHAGILPSLPEEWTTISVRPGASPLASLEHRLRSAGIAATGLATALRDNPAALGELFAERAPMTVLVIDQFEELFTHRVPAVDERDYVRGLLAAAQSVDGRLRIVLTLRDDFLARATQLPELRDRLPPSLFLLGTPARPELVRIVTEPLARIGFEFDDPALVERMVDDVAGVQGALALLSFTATKLWELRDRHFRQLTRKAYDALGGVPGALAQHAEATLTAMSPNEQRLARIGFGHLVTAEGTRAVLSRREAEQLLNDAQAATVLERLVKARLLSATESEDGDDRIEIVHEALVVNWPRLATWRREDAEGARLRDQVRAAARQWLDRDKPRGLLWRDDALAELELWRTRHAQALTEGDEAFVAASFADARRGRRIRRALAIAAFAILVAFLVFQYRATRETQRAKNQIELRAIASYEEQGRKALLDGSHSEALGYLREAMKLGDRSPALQFMVARAIRPLEALHARLDAHGGRVWSAIYSPDGRRIVTNDQRGGHLWDAESGALVADLPGADSRGAAYSPDGKLLATTGQSLQLWDGTTGTFRKKYEIDRGLLWRVAFHPNGKSIAVGRMDGRTLVWDLATEQLVGTIQNDGRSGPDVAFSADGRWLATIGGGHSAQISDANTLAPIVALPHDDEVASVRFSPDGSRVVTADWSGTAYVWEVPSGRRVLALEGSGGKVDLASFSPDGRMIVTASRDNTARVWDAASGKVVAVLRGHRGQVWDAEFDATSTRVVTACQDRSVAVWDLSGRRLGTYEGHTADVYAARFSSDGRNVVTASWDGTARIWNVGDFYRRSSSPEIGDDCVPVEMAALEAVPTLGAPIAIPCASRTVIRSLGHDTELARLPGAQHATVAARGDLVAAATKRDVSVWRIAGGVRTAAWSRPGDVTALAWSPIATTLAVAGVDGSAELVRFEASPPAHVDLAPVLGNIARVVFTPDGRRIVVADAVAHVRVVDADALRIVLDLPAAGPVESMRISPDGRRLVTWYAEVRAPVLWDLERGTRVAELDGHTNLVMNARFDRGSSMLVTASGDGTARVWDARSGVARSPALVGSPQFLYDADFDPSGTLVVAAGGDGAIRFWDVASGKLLWVLDRAHRAFIETVGFIDDEHVVSRGWNGDFAVWKLLHRDVDEATIDRLLGAPTM